MCVCVCIYIYIERERERESFFGFVWYVLPSAEFMLWKLGQGWLWGVAESVSVWALHYMGSGIWFRNIGLTEEPYTLPVGKP